MKPIPTKKVEARYARALRNVARFSGQLVKMHIEGATITDVPGLNRAVSEYMQALAPWARRRALEMVTGVNTNNAKYWGAQAREAGRAMRLELADAPVGLVARNIVAEQVSLITSIPAQAAERAQALAQEAVVDGTRASEVAEMLQATTQVTESRAALIARTEVSKANASINEARSLSVGSEGYIWRTAGDADVRESHAEMDGQFVRWDDPPTLSDGTTTHAGSIYNCRCYAESVLPARDY